jgi:3-oxoacyl-[acyl-carrier-protein] synthase II
VIAEGAGILILKDAEHAKRRRAKIYAKLIGYGASANAHHIIAPVPEGTGAYNAMQCMMH